MKAGWKIAKLGDVCHVYQPETLSQKQLKDGPYPVYGANGQIGFHNEFNHAEPQLTLGCRGTCGVVNWTTENAWINGNAMVVKAVEELVIPQFLSYALKGGINIGDSISGTAQPQITRKSLTPIEIPLPPLAEQKRIVALLDEAFAGIDEAISMIASQSASIKQLLESYLGGVFSTEQHGWETRKLKECTTIIMGQSPEGSTYNAKAIGTPLINGPVEFSADAFGETVKEKWTTEPTKLCKKGDLILCVRGSTTGRMNIAGFDACIGRGVAAIRAKQSQSWVNHFVNASRSKILGMGKGATFPNVSADDIGQMELTIPPKDMQELLSKKFDDLRLLNADMCRSMEKRASLLKTLKSSFLAQAFAGELTA